MGKIKNAKDILNEKGYVQNKFNTNAFMDLVASMFASLPIQGVITLKSVRFVADFYNITPDEREQGFFVLHDDMKNIVRKYNELLLNEDMKYTYNFQERMSFFDESQKLFEEYGNVVYLKENTIYIDQPFFKNAASALRVIGGYVVQRRVSHGDPYYEVMLI